MAKWRVVTGAGFTPDLRILLCFSNRGSINKPVSTLRVGFKTPQHQMGTFKAEVVGELNRIDNFSQMEFLYTPEKRI